MQGIWAASMYLCLCTSRTPSDVLAGPGSNGSWYFKGIVKQFESSESNYECEPGTLRKDLDPRVWRPPWGKVPTGSLLSLAFAYGPFPLPVLSHFLWILCSAPLSALWTCCNEAAVTQKFILHGGSCFLWLLKPEPTFQPLTYPKAFLPLSSSVLAPCRDAGQQMLDKSTDNQDALSPSVCTREGQVLASCSWGTAPKLAMLTALFPPTNAECQRSAKQLCLPWLSKV